MSNRLKVAGLVVVLLVSVGLLVGGLKKLSEKRTEQETRQACLNSVEMICIKAYDCGGFAKLSDCLEAVGGLQVCPEKLLAKQDYDLCLEDLKQLKCTDHMPSRCEYLTP